MKPVNIEQIGEELAIKWTDGTESYVRLEALRRACPCAGCKGETDIMGNVYKNPDRPLNDRAFQLARFVPVGNYAINLIWADGHGSGLYTFDYLREIAGGKTAC